MNTCKHYRKVGDNYGVSCSDCHEQLSGFGYGGWFGKNIPESVKCIHHWMPMDDGEVCLYCEQWRKPDPDPAPAQTIISGGDVLEVQPYRPATTEYDETIPF